MCSLVAGLLLGGTVISYALLNQANELASELALKVGSLVILSGGVVTCWKLRPVQNENSLQTFYNYATKTVVGVTLMTLGHLIIRISTLWKERELANFVKRTFITISSLEEVRMVIHSGGSLKKRSVFVQNMYRALEARIEELKAKQLEIGR